MTDKIKQSAFLFAGTAIGAGMLALPIATGGSGLIPALSYMTLWCAYSIGTMLLLLECIGYADPQTTPGFIQLSKMFSGYLGRFMTQTIYVLLLYAVTSAYIIGGGQLFQQSMHFIGIHLSIASACIVFSAAFALCASFSLRYVGALNQLLMYGLIGSFVLMAYLIVPNLSLTALSEIRCLKYLIPSTTVVVLSFACHNLLPSIIEYLEGDFFAIRRSVLIGMSLPWLIYALWNIVIIGALPPSGAGSILDIQHHHHLHGGELSMLAHALASGAAHSAFSLDKLFVVFGVCAIVTSYIGVAVSLKDFLVQKASLASFRYADFMGMLLAYIPAVCVALMLPHHFSKVLGYAGLMVTYLFGLSPVLWTLRARAKRWDSRYPSGLSTPMVCLLGLLSLMVLSLELYPTSTQEEPVSSLPSE